MAFGHEWESKGERSGWVVELRPAQLDREPGGHEDRRTGSQEDMRTGGPGTGGGEQLSPGSVGGGRWEGEGQAASAEPRENDVPWPPVARKAPCVPSLSTLVIPSPQSTPALHGFDSGGNSAHLAPP